MSKSLENMESEWLSKLAEMRDAISKLNLLKDDSATIQYGSDLGLDDDEFLYGTGSEDIWDFISDDDVDEDDSSQRLIPDGSGLASPTPLPQRFDREWLKHRCLLAASKGSGFDADALNDQVVALIASDSSG